MVRDDSSDFVRLLERSGSAGPTILVIGTLDTKDLEIEFLADAIVDAGGSPVLLDSSVSSGTAESEYPLIGRAEVALASDSTIEDIARLPRGEAVEKTQHGVLKLTEELASAGQIQGAICIGGAGAHLAGPAFQSLPIGFPKLILSPLASGQRTFEPYVGLRDVAVMHSVADIAGVNDITEKVYRSAAGYIVGAAQAFAKGSGATSSDALSTVAISMNGNTTKAMDHGRARLEHAGYGAVVFHANGVGGRALEDFVASGKAAAVLDYTTTELGGHLVGGLMDSGPTRMETAGRIGCPQVLVPGCLDFITCGPVPVAEREFPGRVMFRHNPELTLVRLLPEEMAELGADLRAQGQRCDRADIDPGAHARLLRARRRGRAILGPGRRPGLPRPAPRDRPRRRPRPGDRGPHQRSELRRRRGRRAALDSPAGRGRPGREGSAFGMSGSPKTPLRWGILSTAAIVEELLPGFHASELTDLSAIASRDASRAREFADANGIPSSYGSYEELLADDGIDCVYIPLPNSLHREWTRAALESGKHVLCEKPLTPTSQEAAGLFDLAEQRGLVLMEAFMYRHHPKTKRLRELVAAGDIGEPRVARMWFHFQVEEPAVDIRYDPSSRAAPSATSAATASASRLPQRACTR